MFRVRILGLANLQSSEPCSFKGVAKSVADQTVAPSGGLLNWESFLAGNIKGKVKPHETVNNIQVTRTVGDCLLGYRVNDSTSPLWVEN